MRDKSQKTSRIKLVEDVRELARVHERERAKEFHRIKNGEYTWEIYRHEGYLLIKSKECRQEFVLDKEHKSKLQDKSLQDCS